MNLSLYTGGVRPFLEYATTAAQNIPAAALTTLTLTTELADTGNHGTLASNIVTLASGTYLFKGGTSGTGTGTGDGYLQLTNTTAAAPISYRSFANYRYFNNSAGMMYDGLPIAPEITGQFRLTSSSSIALQIYCASTFTIRTGNFLQLWKLA